MMRSLTITLVLLLSWHSATASMDLKCVSSDVFDAGYFVVGVITADDKLDMQIETINNWTGNTVVYSQFSEILASTGAGHCENLIVDKEYRPNTVLTVSMRTGPALEKLNGVATERFAKLNCEVSAKLVELMKCAQVE